jgi:hypothetical protein
VIEKRATIHCESPVIELLQPGDRVKTAGALPAVQSFLDQLTPDPKYTYVLANAMGYSEFYGPNSNADWYGYNPHLDFNGLLHAWDGIGQDLERDRMLGRDWAYGYPCFYGATVYAHHKNTDPQQLGFGDVRFAFANPTMKRVELLMRVHNEEAQKKGQYSILERLAAGERSDVSMGAKVPFDLSSCCTDWEEVQKAWKTFDPKRHKHPGIAILEYHRTVKPIRGLAVTRNEYCRCFLSNRGKVRGDGLKHFVYNDFPRFFDISFVYVGADRTARAMWHLGSSTRKSSPAVSPALFGLTMGKVASIDKEITGTVEAVCKDVASTPEIRFGAMVEGKSPDAVRALLSTAASLGIVATPREFQKLIGVAEDPKYTLANSCFDPEAGGIDDSYAVSPSDVSQKLLSALIHLAPSRSAFAPFLEPRLKLAGSEGQPLVVDPEKAKLAAMYNGYRLSVLEKISTLVPQAEYHLLPDPLTAKVATNPLAGLLLGVAPMLHLLSAHLRQKRTEGAELGSVASFLADHPTFMSLATLGAAIRVAMLTEGGGVIAKATKLLGPKLL